MAIRFRIPRHAVDRFAFAYSPVLEAVLSLHVLVEPKHHPLQHQWVRKMRRLPPRLRRSIGEFSFLYRFALPDFFLPADTDAYLTFEEELERLRALDDRTIAYELSRPLYDHGGGEPRDPALDDPEVRGAILSRAAQRPEIRDVVHTLVEDPRTVADGFFQFLMEYWEAAFEAEWERTEPTLAEAVTAAGRLLARDGVYGMLRTLPPQLRVDSAREEFGIDVPHEHVVEIAEDERVVLVPSVYVWPDIRVQCDVPWPRAIVYPAPAVQAAGRRELPSGDVLRGLRAVADATRLRILRLIAEQPRCTQELAPLIGMSEAGLSKHLTTLSGAGILARRREGYYVLYEVVPERLEALSDALPSLLSHRDGPPRHD